MLGSQNGIKLPCTEQRAFGFEEAHNIIHAHFLRYLLTRSVVRVPIKRTGFGAPKLISPPLALDMPQVSVNASGLRIRMEVCHPPNCRPSEAVSCLQWQPIIQPNPLS